MAKKVTIISLKEFIGYHAMRAEDYACYQDMLCTFSLDAITLNNSKHLYQQPVRSEYISFIMVESGSISMTVGQQQMTMNAGTICLFRDGIMGMSPQVSSLLKGYVVMISPLLFRKLHLNIRNLIPHMAESKGIGIVSIDERQTYDMHRAIELLHSCIQNDRQSVGYDEMVMSLISYFFHASLSLLGVKEPEKKQEKKKKDGTREDAYFRQFMYHLREHYRQERKIGFYADKVCVSAKYLSSIVRSVSGHGPSHWIDECVITEAKNLLKFSSMTIQEISNELHFPTQSYFGRYFKKHTGMSPREYKLS